MGSNVFVPDDPAASTGEPEQPEQLASALRALQTELRELRETVQGSSPATEDPAAPTVEELLESESFKELLRKSNVETLERVIAQAPRLDAGMRKALLLTLDRMGEESETGEDQVASEGARCLELRERIRTLKGEIEDLDGNRLAFTDEGAAKRAEDRKLVVLLEAEREKVGEQLSEILSTVEGPPPEDEDRWAK